MNLSLSKICTILANCERLVDSYTRAPKKRLLCIGVCETAYLGVSCAQTADNVYVVGFRLE